MILSLLRGRAREGGTQTSLRYILDSSTRSAWSKIERAVQGSDQLFAEVVFFAFDLGIVVR